MDYKEKDKKSLEKVAVFMNWFSLKRLQVKKVFNMVLAMMRWNRYSYALLMQLLIGITF